MKEHFNDKINKMVKIAHIVGARPQFIKCFPISKTIGKLRESSDKNVKEIVIHTGQHYDYAMSKIFFDEFRIRKPDYHLEVRSGPHGKQTGQILQKTEEVLSREKPDIILVYGDTNSTLGGALAAAKLHIPVAHVEAGLRSHNKYMPEEINRILIDNMSTLLFCPSETSVKNLTNEGFKHFLYGGRLIPPSFFSKESEKIWGIQVDKNNPLVVNAGDVMYDVLLNSIETIERKSRILERLQIAGKDYCLLTLHRAENTDNKKRFDEVIEFVNDMSRNREVIFPMHPRTKKTFQKSKTKLSKSIKIIESVGYFDMLTLLKNSSLLMTDSGGMQKEAYWLKIPCITLRDETEWGETLQSGWNILYKEYRVPHTPSDRRTNHYGDGKAAERIVSTIMRFLGI